MNKLKEIIWLATKQPVHRKELTQQPAFNPWNSYKNGRLEPAPKVELSSGPHLHNSMYAHSFPSPTTHIHIMAFLKVAYLIEIISLYSLQPMEFI